MRGFSPFLTLLSPPSILGGCVVNGPVCAVAAIKYY